MSKPSSKGADYLFGEAIYGSSSNIIGNELGAYGEKLLGSSSAYVQSNISRFQVNDQYVKNKLKIILFPFLHKGHWMRSSEKVGGELSYKPPIYDINAPDLYITFMAFGTYLVLAGFLLGINGSGYTFTAVSVTMLARLACRYCYYTITSWECFCMGMFFVKVMKRILIAEMRSCEKHSSKCHYLLLLLAIAQIPLLFWLGNVGV